MKVNSKILEGKADRDAAGVMGLLHEAENLEYTPSETIPTKEFHERKDEVIESEWPDPKRATQEVFVQEEVRPLRPLSAVLGLPSGAVQREDVELRSTADKRERRNMMMSKKEIDRSQRVKVAPCQVGYTPLSMLDKLKFGRQTTMSIGKKILVGTTLISTLLKTCAKGSNPQSSSAEDLADPDKNNFSPQAKTSNEGRG